MKNLGLVLIILFLFSSCAFHSGLSSNLNNNTTEVVLAKKNYRIIESVSGQATATYVFGIGGFSKKGLIDTARSQMLSKIEMIGTSKAIINETVEIKSSFFPIVRTYTVTVSGYVIEFTE